MCMFVFVAQVFLSLTAAAEVGLLAGTRPRRCSCEWSCVCVCENVYLCGSLCLDFYKYLIGCWQPSVSQCGVSVSVWVFTPGPGLLKRDVCGKPTFVVVWFWCMYIGVWCMYVGVSVIVAWLCRLHASCLRQPTCCC